MKSDPDSRFPEKKSFRIPRGQKKVCVPDPIPYVDPQDCTHLKASLTVISAGFLLRLMKAQFPFACDLCSSLYMRYRYAFITTGNGIGIVNEFAVLTVTKKTPFSVDNSHTMTIFLTPKH
jgi:hypothetical protein